MMLSLMNKYTKCCKNNEICRANWNVWVPRCAAEYVKASEKRIPQTSDCPEHTYNACGGAYDCCIQRARDVLWLLTWRAVIAHLFSAALKRREVMPLVLHRHGREEVLPRLSHTWLAHRLCLIAAPALYPAKWHQTGLCHLSEHCLSCRAGHQQCTHQRRLIYGHWLHI